MEKKKQKWEKPKLLILVKSGLGEGVLATCKVGGLPHVPGPQAMADACHQVFGPPPVCGTCVTINPS